MSFKVETLLHSISKGQPTAVNFQSSLLVGKIECINWSTGLPDTNHGRRYRTMTQTPTFPSLFPFPYSLTGHHPPSYHWR